MKKRIYNIDKHRCTIAIGHTIGSTANEMITALADGGTAFVVVDANVFALHAKTIARFLSRCKNHLIVIPSGEATKSAGQVEKLHGWMLSHGITRGDCVLAVGGGVTSDVVGYAASTIVRGVKWGVISTTLLGMVDAALGGKTGINHTSGKNLIGTFWQPTFVLCDTRFLNTLPKRELFAAFGELLKYAALTNKNGRRRILDFVRNPSLMTQEVEEVISECVAYKMDIVTRDERETRGDRMRLNLGHTFAHAIEHSLGYGVLLHGEAVTLGLNAACELRKLLGSKPDKAMDHWQHDVRQVMSAIPKKRLSASAMLSAMMSDKKRSSASLRFVLLESPGKPILLTGVSDTLVKKAIAAMIAAWQK